RTRVRHLRRPAVCGEMAATAPAVERAVTYDAVDHVQLCVIVVEEEAEQTVVAPCQLTQPNRECAIRELRICCFAQRTPVRIGEVQLVEVIVDLEAQERAHDGNWSADESGNVLRAESGERVDTPEGGVDRAQHRGERRFLAIRARKSSAS